MDAQKYNYDRIINSSTFRAHNCRTMYVYDSHNKNQLNFGKAPDGTLSIYMRSSAWEMGLVA